MWLGKLDLNETSLRIHFHFSKKRFTITSSLFQNMADPPTQPHSAQNFSSITNANSHPQDFSLSSTAADPDPYVDLEMEDDTARDPQTQHGQDTSSSTLDHEHTTQTDTQQQEEPAPQADSSTSNNPPLSRKDASLREFLSKMDDYAPIVR